MQFAATFTPETEQSAQPPLLMRAGTEIICERGHHLCTTAVDLRVNQTLSVEMFSVWQVDAPQAGDRFPRCSVCGGAAHREGRDGVTLHTPTGWRWACVPGRRRV